MFISSYMHCHDIVTMLRIAILAQGSTALSINGDSHFSPPTLNLLGVMTARCVTAIPLRPALAFAAARAVGRGHVTVPPPTLILCVVTA